MDENKAKPPGRLKRFGAWAIGSRRTLSLATASGVLVFMSFPAWNFFPLAFFALVPMLLVAERASRARHALGWGWWMGFITNLGGFYWIAPMLKVYGFMPWSVTLILHGALCAQQALTWALVFWLGRWMTRRNAPMWLAYPAAIAVAETVNPLIFPWYFGNSQYLNLPFIQAAELGGVQLLSSMLVLANVAVFAAWKWKYGGGQFPRFAGVVAAILALQMLYGGIRIAQIDAEVAAAPTVQVGVVQANIGIYTKTDQSSLLQNLLLHQELSAELEAQGAELIIWPETAYGPPAYFAEGEGPPELSRILRRDSTRLPPSSAPLPTPENPGPATARLADLVPPQRGFTTPLITGTLFWRIRTDEEAALAPTRRGAPVSIELFNSAMLLDEEGIVLGTYDKTLRMIFSEYLPGAYALFRLTGFSIYDYVPMAGDFLAGQPTDGFVLPLNGEEIPIGIMICYEDIMPSFGRAIHSGAPEFIVNVTNDAWFLDTAEPELHLALSVFRTIEQRTSLIRSTNTGISAVMDPVGRVVAETETFVQTTLLHDVVRLKATTTPFMRLGNWSAWLGALVLAGVGLRTRRNRTRVRA